MGHARGRRPDATSEVGPSRAPRDDHVAAGPAGGTGSAGRRLLALQASAGDRAVTNLVRPVQRQDERSTDRMREQIEDLLRQLPVGTPEEANATQEVLNQVISARGAAGTGAFTLVQKLQDGDVGDVLQALVAVVGDGALVVQVLTYTAQQMGVITSAVSGAAMAGTVAGMIANAAGPLALAVGVMAGVLSIPSDVNENFWKILYIGDVSGILTAWIFDDDAISPHRELVREAPTLGYFDTDLSDAVRTARERAEAVWREHFRGHPHAIRQVRQAAGDDHRRLWRELAGALEAQLQPDPDGVAVAYVNRLIRGAGYRQLERHRRRNARRARERFRREGGTIRTPEGFEFEIPPTP